MRPPAFLRDAPIRRKLLAIALLSAGAALLFVALASIVQQWFELRAALVKTASSQAAIVATNSTAALAFNDPKAATQTLAALAAIDNVEFAMLHDRQGAAFASYVPPGRPPIAPHHPPAGEGHAFAATHLDVFRPVMLDGEPIGAIHLRISLAPVYEQMAWSLLLGAVATLGGLGVAWLLVSRLHPAVTGPIGALVALMGAVARDKDYGLRAPPGGRDELGRLVEGFNDMLGHIQQRDAELGRHRERLEEEVARRTADLEEATVRLREELAERRRAEAALRDSEEKFRTISGSAQDAVIMVDNGGNISYWNAAAEKIFGYAPEEALGRELHGFLAPERFRAAYRAAFPRFRATGEGGAVGRTLELAALRKGGGEFPMEISLSAVRVGNRWNAIGIVRDITERKSAEAEQRQLSEALRQSQEAVIVAEPDLRFAYVNPAFSRLFGYGQAEVVGRPLSLLAPAAALPGPEQVVAKAIATGAFHGEVMRRAKDGREIPVLLNVAPVRDGAGAIVSFVGTMADLTELKQAEAEAKARLAEVMRINAELGQAQNQLLQSEKMASVGLLAAGVAHEINNPVGYVQSNLSTLEEYVGSFLLLLDAYERLEAPLPQGEAKLAQVRALKEQFDLPYLRQDVAALLRESREGINRVKKIVADLKGFSRVDEAETWKAEDLHAGLESTLNVVWNELKYKCEVRKEYGELPPVECLLSQLNQVFMNLLVNAAQAIEDKGVVTIRTGVAGEEVWIEIADTGKGIAPEHLKRVFDPFFTTKPVGKGTGLGLSVSYSIVQKHHGSIEVESKVGEGTTFRIRLPVRQPGADETAEGGR